jgi:tetratricopeptide (TPR) repeat protein
MNYLLNGGKKVHKLRKMVCFGTILIATVTFAQMAPMPPQQPSSALPALNPQFGKVNFRTSTKNAQAQQYFEQAMALYYGFNHGEAEKCFAAAAQLDPNFAMAQWGIALAVGPNYNVDVDAEREKQAFSAITRAKALAAGAPADERAYIDALATRYSNAAKPDYHALAVAYSKAMRELSHNYPSDLEAATLFAESMMDLRPWELWTKTGLPMPGTEEIVSTLESVLKRDPDHIGANHFYIHAVEESPDPGRALPSADRLAGLAPASGHLVHMPAHIYIRTGNHEKSLATNETAAKMDEEFFRTHPPGVYAMYYAHNLNFIVVEACFLGRSTEAAASAKKLYEQAAPLAAEMPMVDPGLAMPVLVDLRFRRWDNVLKSPAPAANLPISSYLWHYARALAFASTDRPSDANREVAAMQQLADKASVVPVNPVGARNAARMVQIADHVVRAKLAEKSEDMDGTLGHLRAAVALEDQMDYDEPPDWIAPVRESLGGFLLRSKRYSEADEVFRADLKRNPNSPRSLFGLAEALRGEGQAAAAQDAEQRFQQHWKNADVKLSTGDL